MLKKIAALSLLSLLSLLNNLQAVTSTTVTMTSGDFTLMGSNGTTPLAIGSVLQLGYYSGNNGTDFTGTWHPLTGNLGANSAYTSNSNINGPGAGQFNNLTFVFDTADSTKNQDLPASASIRLTIRFYNAATVAGATFFNAITNDTWLWKIPADNSPSANPEVNLNLNDTGNFRLQSSPGSTFTYAPGGFAYVPSTTLATTVAVPEPSSLAYLAVVFSMTAVAVRFRKF